MGGPGPAETGRAALTGTLPFAAPAAPQPAWAVAVTSRGGAAPPGPPTTLGDLLGDGLTKRGVPEFLAVLDADVSTPLDIFFSVSEDDLMHALAATTVEGIALSAMGRAGVVHLVRRLFEDAGYEPPGFGTAPRRAPTAEVSAASSAMALPSAPQRTPELEGELVSLAQ